MKFKDLFIQFEIEKTKTLKHRVGYNSTYDDIVLKKMPLLLEERIKNSDVIIKRSVGMTNYAHIPWICLISSNPRIARNAQKGIYVVILFTKKGDAFYLSLSQGYTYFKEMPIALKVRDDLIAESVSYFQSELNGDIINRYKFTTAKIDLGEYIGDLGKGYIKTTILSKRFDVRAFDENDFYLSLEAILREYDDIIMHFGNKSYDEVIDLITNQSDHEPLDVALENIEKAITENFVEYRDISHKPVQVQKGDLRSNKYLKIAQRIIRKKADFLQLARDNFQTGVIGEKLALKIERDRLLEIGVDPDKYVNRVSIESDSYGYDIESVDIRNGKLIKIFIEVKSTKDISDGSFFVSKNEIEVSKQKESTYRVLRIFDITSIAPKYYFADGKIEDNFYLDPITFSATYKFEISSS